MAELDEIVQKVILQGDDELLNALAKIGNEGKEAIEKIAEATENGAGRIATLANVIGALEAAVGTLTVALLGFVEEQTEAIQRTILLGQAFGATTAQVQSLETAFAAAGVSTQVFERFAQRLTTTIAQQWPEISKSIRTSADQQAEAQDKVVSATVRVQQAQNALLNNSEDTASQIAADNSKIEHTFVALQFAGQAAAAQLQKDFNNVSGAALSLESAEQRLATLQGRPPSESEKQNLALKEAQLAVDKARQAQTDAITAQQKNQAEAIQKRKDLEQALSDAQNKRFEDEQKAELTRIQLETAVREAVISRSKAEEAAHQSSLSNVSAIAGALKGIADGNKDAAKSVDLTEISVQNLTRGIIAAASAGGTKPPDGLTVLNQLIKTLSSDTDNLIPKAERLALVQRLGGQSMRATGTDAAELLAAIEKGPAFFDKFSDAAKNAYSNTHAGQEATEHFREALTSFNQALGLTQQNLAALAAPGLSTFLHTLEESLKSDTGLLHLFVDGITAIGAAIGGIASGFRAAGDAIDHAFNLEHGKGLEILIGGIILLVALFASAWLAVPAAIAVVGVAIGYIYDHLGEVKKAGIAAFEWLKDSLIGRAIQSLIKGFERMVELFKEMKAAAPTWLGGGGGASKSNAAAQAGGNSDGAVAGNESVAQGLAGGGEVDGPGTTTSDSIFARLSRGEFVVKAAAVQNYGTDLFHKLNNMQFPGFAMGGLVPSPVRMAGVSGAQTATSTVNLTIGGRTFEGFRGPKATVDDLADYAIGQQTSSAGRQPSWVR